MLAPALCATRICVLDVAGLRYLEEHVDLRELLWVSSVCGQF